MIIDITKRPAGKTGWKIEDSNYTFSNQKLLEVLKANILFRNDCLVQFHNLGECDALGLDPNSIHIIQKRLFSLKEACEFIQARIDHKRIEINLKYF